MATFTWIPDQAASRESKARVLEAKFGDGYAQRTPDGINSISEEWDLNFTLRTKTEILAIVAFLKAAKGATPFDWTTPSGSALKFVCKSWRDSYNHDWDCSLSCKLEQDFSA